MVDVAKAAGVSKQTVSRVINAKGDTSEATIRKVQSAIQQLGYRPNGIARSLATRQTLTLGLMIPNLSNPFYSEIAEGAEMMAWEQGYNAFMANVFRNAEREKVTLAAFEQKGVDGVIVMKPRLEDAELFPLLKQHGAALVIDRTVPNDIAGSIRIDYASGMELAVKHLIESGRRNIGLLPGRLRSESGKAQYKGFLSAMQRVGCEVNHNYIIHCKTTVEASMAGAKQLLSACPEVDSLICFNDMVALGVVQACHALGVRIPDNVAVVGQGDIAMARLLIPSLTTLHVDRFTVGANAVRLLLDRINGRNKSVEIVIKPELIVRDSAPRR